MTLIPSVLLSYLWPVISSGIFLDNRKTVVVEVGLCFETVNVSLVDGNENKSFEYSEWIVKEHDRSMRHIMVYRPPYSSLHPVPASVSFDEFSQFLENVDVPQGSCYLWRLQPSFR